MPRKIKLPAPVAAADIGLTSLTELAKEKTNKTLFSNSSGRHANDFEASGFPLPPLPHQGRNHADVTADAAARHELSASTDLSNHGRKQNYFLPAGFLPSNQTQQPTPNLPTQFNFSENNHASAGQYNDPMRGWQQHEKQHQKQHQTAVNDPISDQAGYKDFLPPSIHVAKNGEKVSDANNDGSAVALRINNHASSPHREEPNSSNHGCLDQQQHRSLLPPLSQEKVKGTSEKEKESKVLENSKRNVAATSNSADSQQIQNDEIPVYEYCSSYQKKSWKEMVEMLTKFFVVNGHSNVEMEGGKIFIDGNNQNNEDGDSEEKTLLMLRSWVRELRYIRNADHLSGVEISSKKRSAAHQKQQQRCDSENLTPERIFQLNELAFPWKNNLSQWQTWLDDLMHYQAKNGDSNVPLKCPEHPSLGNFVNRQRGDYKKLRQGKPSSMTGTKIQDLERIGFVWSVREGGHSSWDERLAELVAYRRIHGDTLVPKKYPQNPSLGYWVNEQRFQYQRYINGKSSTMNKKRRERLNSINFKWIVRKSPREFSEWIKLLKEYKNQWGHCNVPLKYEQDPSLGTFVNNARTQYKKFQSGLPSNMTQEKM